MKINQEDFRRLMQHAKCCKGSIEASTFYGYELDGKDGIAKALCCRDGIIPKVDYFVRDKSDNHRIWLIEFTDLRENAEKAKSILAQKEEECRIKESKETLSSKDERRIRKAYRKEAWGALQDEIKFKWVGSIAAIERLYRKLQIFDDDPSFHILIVVKDSMLHEIQMLDLVQEDLESLLSGMVGKVRFCTTNTISKYVAQ